MKTKLFCNYCQGSLDMRLAEGKERQVCTACGEIYYENPLPVVSIMVANENRELLLVKRAQEPAKGMWCFPIGFAESGESIEDAAMRELKEEAGIDGRIVQIVDVTSEKNDVYGDVLVVTFEAERVAGNASAGDDAVDARYFPIANLPKLAFSSQEKALAKFIPLKKDLWDMTDSFQMLVRETTHGEYPSTGRLLSDELVKAIEENTPRIIELWLEDISTNPSTRHFQARDRSELSSGAAVLIGELGRWLRGDKSKADKDEADKDEAKLKKLCSDLGRRPGKGEAPLEETISAVSLLKKHIFKLTSSMGVWHRPVDIYKVVELSERLVYFFDRASYYVIAGYHKSSA
jgi:ADP-ribose pyrophosphatase YjhB (NUDIX family)